LNAAQCGQVIDAYSAIVMAASAGPSAMSGSNVGSVTLSVVLVARTSLIRRNGESPINAATPVHDRAVVTARRVMTKIGSRVGALARRPVAMLAALFQIGNRFDSLTLEQSLDPLVEFLKRGLAFDHLAIEEESRRRIHFKCFRGVFLVGDDLVEQGLILQAGFDLLLA
jgi:hypothetical protein